MADYQRVVEFLRDFRSAPVQQGSGEISEELRQAAAEYAELCAQANDRLRQCSTFLQQGLRSEAIHLADGGGGEAPNLLDLVAALDLPDAAQWVEFCQNNGLPVPVTLQMERAGQLDGAYSAEQPLEHLLSRHRLLALSRGPVRERLNVMRQLAAQDPAGANSFWEKDLRVFERARLRELPAAFYAAVKSRDFQTITALQTELSQYPWYEAIPDDLRQAVGTAYDRMHRSEVEGSIKEIINRLHDAFAARNQGDCAALMAQIKDTLTANNLKDLSGELREEVKPIRDWLASENELASKHKSFMAACGDFTRRMDADAPDHELEAAHAKLNSFEEPVPEELERRYEEKLRGRHEAAQRSLRIKLFSVIGSLAAVVVVVGLILWVVSNNASASKWISGIKQANADRTLTYAH